MEKIHPEAEWLFKRPPLVRGDRLKPNTRERKSALKMLEKMGRKNPESWLHRYAFYCVSELDRNGRTRLSPGYRHPECVEYRYQGENDATQDTPQQSRDRSKSDVAERASDFRDGTTPSRRIRSRATRGIPSGRGRAPASGRGPLLPADS